jgi:putative protease
VELKFAPHPDKTFHRGATDYFTHGRSKDPAHITAFDTPAFVGLPLGKVTQVGDAWFEIATQENMANGDGLSWLAKRQAAGTQANRVEKVAAGLWRVWPNDPIDQLPGLKSGLYVNRNRDQAWEQALTKESAERRIAVDAHLTETPGGFALALTDADGIAATATLALEKQPAKDPGRAEASLQEQFRRLGGTDFRLRGCTVAWSQPWFVPNSAANALRRDAVAALAAARAAAYIRPQRRPPVEPPAPCPEETLSYLANVYNAAARRFYEKHGVKLIKPAYEVHAEKGEVSLMITKHCLRHAFNLCPHQAKGVTGVQGQVRAEPLTLLSGDERFTLTFDCRACEMHVIGRIRPQILASPPPGSDA